MSILTHSSTCRILPRSLTLRLAVIYSGALLIILGLAFLLLYASMRSIIDHRMTEDLEEDIRDFTALYKAAGDSAVTDEIRRESEAGDSSAMFIRFFNTDGQLLASTDMTQWPAIPVDRKAISRMEFGVSDTELSTWMLPERDEPTRLIQGAIGKGRVLIVGEYLQARGDIIRLLRIAILGVFLLAVPLAFAVVWSLSKRAVRGIGKVSQAAIGIRQGHLDRRVAAVGEVAEVQKLSDTFDEMAGRIQRLVKHMQEITDNIAHDLRSPLTRIRVTAESVLLDRLDTAGCQQVAVDIMTECDYLVNMINLSLDVAETEAGVFRADSSKVNIGLMLQDVCEMFEAAAETRALQIHCRLDEGCVVCGDSQGLQRMLANLLDNAIKFGEGPGDIVVLLTGDEKTLSLSIENPGRGIPEQHRQKIFDRFYRGDSSRAVNGCGLGLSYARAVAQAHGGQIRVDSVIDQYTRFTVSLMRITEPADDAHDGDAAPINGNVI